MPLVWTSQPGVLSRPTFNQPVNGLAASATGALVMMYADGSGNTQVDRSTDGGVTWTNVQILGGFTVRFLAYSAANSGKFIAFGGTQNYVSTDDGVTWTNISVGLGSGWTIRAVVADGGSPQQWWAFGSSAGTGFYSNDDGATWSNFSPPGFSGWNGVWANNELFMSVGGGFVESSPDGISWTSTNCGTGGGTWVAGSTSLSQMALDPVTGNIILSALDGGAAVVAASATPGVMPSTTPVALGSISPFINCIVGAGGSFFVASQFHLFADSPDGVTWSDGSVSGTIPDSQIQVVFVPVHNVFAMGGSSGSIVTSGVVGTIVPNVVGQPLATAEANIVAAGLVVGTVSMAASGSVPAGDVISTSPPAGTVVAPASSVDIMESTGPANVVPDVTGLSLAAATSAITGAGFVVGTVTTTPSPTVPNGDIITQNPVGGTVASAGSAVDLTESTGPATGTVPNVVGLTVTTADSTILGAGFFVGTTTGAFSTTVPLNLVISQSPIAGSVEILGTAVDFTYSLGIPPVAVPDVIGDALIVGENTIISASLVVGPISAQISPGTPIGTILGQSPAPGTLVPPGTAVSLTSVSAFANAFPVTQTVISQYANSPTLLQLVNNMAQYLDQSVNFVNFFQFVWNVDTAVGFGLDIWGKIVGVSRLLHIGANQDTFGFENSDRPYDWQNFGGGTFFNGGSGTAYILPDDAYRILILTKALANITATTSQALNQLLRNLFPGRGVCFVRDNLDMTMTFVFKFPLTPIEFAILTQSGALPHPAGVGFNVLVVPPDRFGFHEAGPAALPFNFGVFYLPS